MYLLFAATIHYIYKFYIYIYNYHSLLIGNLAFFLKCLKKLDYFPPSQRKITKYLDASLSEEELFLIIYHVGQIRVQEGEIGFKEGNQRFDMVLREHKYYEKHLILLIIIYSFNHLFRENFLLFFLCTWIWTFIIALPMKVAEKKVEKGIKKCPQVIPARSNKGLGI